MQRYFIEENLTPHTSWQLPPAVYHHAIKVLRTKVGTHFEIVGPNELVGEVELTAVDQKEKTAVAQVLTMRQVAVELPVSATIVCGLAKQDKAAWVVQKATELGVARIIFVPTQYAIAKWHPKKVAAKLTRLQTIAQNAAEQAHRTHVPQVTYLPSVAEVAQLQADVKLVAYEESAKQGEMTQFAQAVATLKKLPEGSRVIGFFGPEGGISPAEVAQLQQAGFKLCGLGPRILRTETAPLYWLSALSAALELGC